MATTKKPTEPASEASTEVYLVSHPQEDGVIAVKATSAQDAAEQTKPKEQE